MGNISYKNMKSILDVFFKRKVIHKNDITDYYTDITMSTVNTAITKLKKAKMIVKLKGTNLINEDFIDKTYFTNEENNISNISATIVNEYEHSGEILNYFYKEVPENITNAITHEFSNKYDKNLIHLIEYDKYLFFINLIEESRHGQRPIVLLTHKYGHKKKCIPLEIYIRDGMSNLLVLDLKSNEFESLLLVNTLNAKISDETYDEYIDKKDIQSALYDLRGLNTLRSKTITASAELIMELKSKNLINKYEIIEEDEEVLRRKDQHDLYKKETFDSKSTKYFKKQSYRTYKFKIETTRRKLKFIEHTYNL